MNFWLTLPEIRWQSCLPPRPQFASPRCRRQVMVLTGRMFVAGAAGFALLGRSHGMSSHLSCGALGIKASQTETIDYAARYGFDVVDALSLIHISEPTRRT